MITISNALATVRAVSIKNLSPTIVNIYSYEETPSGP